MIGLFDSGLGGLTALCEVRKVLPNADIVYFGDTARIPYGTRSPEVIDRYAVQDCSFLVSLGADAVLAACGTVSSNSLPLLQSRFSLPVLGVVDGAARRAAQIAENGNGRVLVLGTESTIKSRAFERAVLEMNPALKVSGIACPMFVPLVENWHTSPDDEAAFAIAREYLLPAVGEKPDAVILGCTHYPLLSELIKHFLPDSELVNSGKEAAKILAETLESRNIPAGNGGTTVFYASDAPERFAEGAKRFLGGGIGDCRVCRASVSDTL